MGDEGRRIARRAGVVAAGTLTSRVLGLARDIVIAATFGKGATDAFFLAFTIPNTLRRLVGEGSLTASFVPVFAETLEQQGKDEARLVVRRTLGALLVLLVVVCILGVVFSREVVLAFAAGWRDDAEKLALTTRLARWMFSYIGLMGLVALAMGVLNTLRRFFAPAFSPLLLNVALIGAALGLVPVFEAHGYTPIMALAFGVLAGGVLQLVFQLPALAREKMLVGPALGLSDPRVRHIGRLMLPGILGLAVYQIDILLSRQFASGLPEGSVTYLYYAQRFAELPQGVVTMAIASAALPSLARFAARDAWQELRETYGYSLRLSLFVTTPAAIACIFLATPIVAVTLQRGAFTPTMTAETAGALALWGAGTWAVAGVRQTVPIFFALQDTRTPALLAAANLGVFVGGCLLLMPGLGHRGIALAVALAATTQLVGLIVLLRRKVGLLGLRRITASLVRMAIAAAAMGTVGVAIARAGDWAQGGTARNTAILAASLLGGLAAFVLVARLVGSPELGEVRDAIARRKPPA